MHTMLAILSIIMIVGSFVYEVLFDENGDTASLSMAVSAVGAVIGIVNFVLLVAQL